MESRSRGLKKIKIEGLFRTKVQPSLDPEKVEVAYGSAKAGAFARVDLNGSALVLKNLVIRKDLGATVPWLGRKVLNLQGSVV